MELNLQLAAKFDSAQDPALRTLTRIFGVVWLINAAFQAMAWLFVPAAAANFIHALAKPASTVPHWIRPLLLAAVDTAQTVGPQVIAGIMVVIAILLGVALLSGKKVALAARIGIIYCLLCWVFLNGFGFPYSGGQTDPGVLVDYAITFLFVLSVAPDLNSTTGSLHETRGRLWETARLWFGLLWLFDAALKWLPAFMFHFTSQITGVIAGQPAWVAAWLRFVAEIIHAVGPVRVAIVVGLSETVIAVGLLGAKQLGSKWLRWITLFGMAYSLGVWCTAEAFGGPYSSAGTGVRGNVVGNVLMYLLPFLFLLIGTLRNRTTET
jgi:hypothetical protein